MVVFETATLDSDMTNEAAWQARPELERQWKARQAADAKALANKNRADAAGVKAASVTKLDTDHSDEEAWKARATLKARSKAKREKEAAALAASNAKFFGGVRATESNVGDGEGKLIDINIEDEEEWAAMHDLHAKSAALRQREIDDLAMRNLAASRRLRNIKPSVIITSPSGKAEYAKPNYVSPCKFDAEAAGKRTMIEVQTQTMRGRYVSRLRHEAHDLSYMQQRPPSWLKAWECYDWQDVGSVSLLEYTPEKQGSALW